MSSRKKSKKSRKAPGPGKKSGRVGVILNRIGMLLVLAFVVFALYVTFTKPPAPAPTGPKLPQRTGTAWEYDARFDAYWDPRQGHEHWHEGRPPEDQDP